MAAHPKPKKRRPSAQTQDRKLRELVAVAYADAQIEPKVHLQNLEMIVAWVKTGRKPGDKPDLRVVDNQVG
jgi:hypothetical protein